MKKYLFIAAAATLAACSNETLVETPQLPEEKEVAIGFGTGFNNMTRAENNDHATQLNGLENYHQNFRVWGYKNIATDVENEFERVAVFSGNVDEDYATAAQSIVTYDKDAPAPFDTYKWKYDPIRYWDKSAANYDFHAAAPQKFGTTNLAWVWTPSNVKDGKGEGNFSIEAQSVKGESLPLNKEVTKQVEGKDQDAFGKATSVKDCDLMIATDITNYSVFTKEPVHFLFNHILSRLNIGVRIGTDVYVDNESAPTTGVVQLKDVAIVKVFTKGDFDEALERDEEKVKEGTIARWENRVTPTTADKPFGFPNEVVTGEEDGDAVATELNLSKTFTNEGIEYTRNDFKMVYQGLMIPQEIKFEDIKVDGSNIKTAQYPYLYIHYTIDGEEFKNYYNLAAVFSAVSVPFTDENGNEAVLLFGDAGYAFSTPSGLVLADGTPITCFGGYKDGQYYQSDMNTGLKPLYYDSTTNKFYTDETTHDDTTLYPAQVFVMLNSDNTHRKVLRSEIPGECDINFFEGWQNNLWITINPTAILFDADVYQWADKFENEHTVE